MKFHKNKISYSSPTSQQTQIGPTDVQIAAEFWSSGSPHLVQNRSCKDVFLRRPGDV